MLVIFRQSAVVTEATVCACCGRFGLKLVTPAGEGLEASWPYEADPLEPAVYAWEPD